MDRRDQILKDNQEYHRLFNQWRTYENLTTLLAILGLLATIINFEIDSSLGLMTTFIH
jgi:hypothetical protein